MNIETIRGFCLAMPDVEEGFPFGLDTIVFKVKNKIFLLAGLNNDPLRVNVKCDPDKAIELREQYDSVQPGYHMNKKHWNTIEINGEVTTKELKEWITESYSLVKEKKKT